MATVATKPLHVRLTPDQRKAFDDAAAREGLQTGPWLRQLGIKAADAARRPFMDAPDGSTVYLRRGEA